MSQSSVVLPVVGTVSGATMASDMNAALDAFRTMFSGATAPTADAAEEGQYWLDTSTTPKTIRLYDGSSWCVTAYLDDSGHLFAPMVGGQTATIASASTVSLGAATAPYAAVTISGTVTITSFGSSARTGQLFFLTFSGALTLTYNASSLILPGAASIATAAGDTAIMQYNGSSNWKCIAFSPASGQPLSGAGNVTGAFQTSGVSSPAQITASQNDYALSATATVFELTTDGLADYLITGIASGTSGRQIILRNKNAAGGGRLIFTNQSASSSAANRFKMAGAVTLNPQQQQEFIYDNGESRWVSKNIIVAQPIAGIQGGIKNLSIIATTTAPTMVITADRAVLEDADGNATIVNSVSVSPSLAASGANGIDNGAYAGAVGYYGFIIANSLTNAVAGLLSTSLSPVMPSGYTFKTMCGWDVPATSTSFQLMKQYGDLAVAGNWSDVTTHPPSTALLNVTLGGPPNTEWIGSVFNFAGSGNLAVAPTGSTMLVTGNFYIGTVGAWVDRFHIMLDGNSQIQITAGSGLSTNNRADFVTEGWRWTGYAK